MTIHQLNLTYLPQEDRILLRINTNDAEEFRFLLTRRITLFLLQQMETHFSNLPSEVRASVPNNMGGIKDQNNVAESFINGETFPIGSDALLVQESQWTAKSINQEFHAEITLAIGAGRQISLMISEAILLPFFQMLTTLYQQVGWLLVPKNLQEPIMTGFTFDHYGGSSSIH